MSASLEPVAHRRSQVALGKAWAASTRVASWGDGMAQLRGMGRFQSRARVCCTAPNEAVHRLRHEDVQSQAGRMRNHWAQHCQWHRVVPEDGPPPIACDALKQSARVFRAPTGNPDRGLTRASCETHPLPTTTSPREDRTHGCPWPETRGCIHVQGTQKPSLAHERDARLWAPLGSSSPPTP